MTTKYKATEQDLPSIFTESHQRISVVASAKMNIHMCAQAMGIEISSDELQKFALLLVAIEQD
jgi:hypothetical protein